MRIYIYLAIAIMVTFISFKFLDLSKDLIVKEICNQCTVQETTKYIEEKYQITDSLIFTKQDSLGEIRTDIPPKIYNNQVHFLTNKRMVISYALKQNEKSNPKFLTRLPNAQPFISDFLVVNDSVLIYVSSQNTQLVEYNYKTEKYRIINLLNENFINSLPFLGLELIEKKDNYIFPYIERNDYEENSNFLGVYNTNYHYKNGLGSFREYENNSFAPYYDSPIISNFIEGEFMVCSSSSRGIAQFKLNDSNSEIELENTFCFKNKLLGNPEENIPRSKLGDFNFLNERYITESYIMSLKWIGKSIYRITKCKQPLINESGMMNTIEMSPWTFENYNVKENRVTYFQMEPNKYKFSNTIIFEGKLFFLTFENNKIIYHALS